MVDTATTALQQRDQVEGTRQALKVWKTERVYEGIAGGGMMGVSVAGGRKDALRCTRARRAAARTSRRRLARAPQTRAPNRTTSPRPSTKNQVPAKAVAAATAPAALAREAAAAAKAAAASAAAAAPAGPAATTAADDDDASFELSPAGGLDPSRTRALVVILHGAIYVRRGRPLLSGMSRSCGRPLRSNASTTALHHTPHPIHDGPPRPQASAPTSRACARPS